MKKHGAANALWIVGWKIWIRIFMCKNLVINESLRSTKVGYGAKLWSKQCPIKIRKGGNLSTPPEFPFIEGFTFTHLQVEENTNKNVSVF